MTDKAGDNYYYNQYSIRDACIYIPKKCGKQLTGRQERKFKTAKVFNLFPLLGWTLL